MEGAETATAFGCPVQRLRQSNQGLPRLDHGRQHLREDQGTTQPHFYPPQPLIFSKRSLIFSKRSWPASVPGREANQIADAKYGMTYLDPGGGEYIYDEASGC